jgi:hypothetical protein
MTLLDQAKRHQHTRLDTGSQISKACEAQATPIFWQCARAVDGLQLHRAGRNSVLQPTPLAAR